MTLICALLITYKLNRPLLKLIRAAKQIGKGKTPEADPKEIQDLCHTFNQMSRDINKLSEDRSLLLAGVSHDLRTPLVRMRLAQEMLDKNIDPDLQSGMLQDIEDMDTIIGQFLDFIKESAEEITQPVDLNKLIQKTCKLYLERGESITLTLDQLPTLTIRPMAIKRLLVNLIDNFHLRISILRRSLY